MIISHSRPNLLWSFTNATPVTSLDRLTNGRPTASTRFDASDTMTITGSTGGGNVIPQLCGLVNVSLDIGTFVTCEYKRAGDGAYGYQSQTQSVAIADDGSKSVWFGYEEGLDAVTNVRFTIPLSVPSGGIFVDIGEVWLGPGGIYPTLATYGTQYEQYSKQQLSTTGQPYPVDRASAIKHAVELVPYRYNRGYIYTGNVNAMRAALAGYSTCAIAPITSKMFDDNAAIDPDYVNKTAALCYASSLGDAKFAETEFGLNLEFTQIPARP